MDRIQSDRTAVLIYQQPGEGEQERHGLPQGHDAAAHIPLRTNTAPAANQPLPRRQQISFIDFLGHGIGFDGEGLCIPTQFKSDVHVATGTYENTANGETECQKNPVRPRDFDSMMEAFVEVSSPLLLLRNRSLSRHISLS